MEVNTSVLSMIDEVQAASQRAELGAQIAAAEGTTREDVIFPASFEAFMKSSSKRGITAQNFMAVLAGLQFAVVILIAQRRIPLADPTEFFVVLSMLMVTAAHAKILDFLPDGNSIVNDLEAIKFLVIGFPIVIFMVIIEMWFIGYLFSYRPEVELSAFMDNAASILAVAKTLSISKVLVVSTVRILAPVFRACRPSKKR
ncbi:Hypothetical Protein FCC1311_097022 [Hondaea fermentalgiana]|uniref:Uncharacterized protein n=1 Tax=Hondaea fermentalgiana TaxID=2315210 RepID=A0A2R5GT35_9STRA|nr:Hypothetical Protein FCC1311_097022 [Hondaea fermentalgiana]|eukprot:GBG33479.1 Hypothetical Protein FCC1311_097022 [Hondaea fermentalgiana]